VIGHLQLISLDAVAGEIKNLAVTERFQRRGVGSALISTRSISVVTTAGSG